MHRPSISIANWRIWTVTGIIYIGFTMLFLLPVFEQHLATITVNKDLTSYLGSIKQDKKPISSPSLISGTPISISINRLGVNLPIEKGYYDNLDGTWTLNNYHAFVDASTVANPVVSNATTGNAFIYAHDFENLFEKTSQLIPGDLVNITTSNDYIFTYEYQSGAIVEPSSTYILTQQGNKDQLTLMTCSGAWYQNRHVMYFSFLNVQPLKSKTAQT
ncbi:MAG TPA: sortase [Candidatus Saccharimonadales bacterium]|nr:sortase [Candidatus Saccharimonadales bacterium]